MPDGNAGPESAILGEYQLLTCQAPLHASYHASKGSPSKISTCIVVLTRWLYNSSNAGFSCIKKLSRSFS